MSPPLEIFQLGMDGYRHHQGCSMFTLSAHLIESIVGPLNMVVLVVLQHTGVPVGVDCDAIFKVSWSHIGLEWLCGRRRHRDNFDSGLFLIPIHQSQCPISSPFRYNDFQHDPLGKCNCTPPYSGENGISARSDLNPANGTYPFSALGHRSHGGTDNKVSRRVGKKTSWCWRCAVLLFTNLTTLVLMILSCVYASRVKQLFLNVCLCVCLSIFLVVPVPLTWYS